RRRRSTHRPKPRCHPRLRRIRLPGRPCRRRLPRRLRTGSRPERAWFGDFPGPRHLPCLPPYRPHPWHRIPRPSPLRGVGGGRGCAVVHGASRRPVRALRTLRGDLEVPVLDVDLAVFAGPMNLLFSPASGSRRAEVTGLGLPALIVLAVTEVELVLLRLARTVVDRDLHLSVFVRFGHFERAVTLLHGQGVSIITDVRDGLAGFGVDRVRLARFRVDLQFITGDRVLPLVLSEDLRFRNRGSARCGAPAARRSTTIAAGILRAGVLESVLARIRQTEVTAFGKLAGVILEVIVELLPRAVDLLLRVVTDRGE